MGIPIDFEVALKHFGTTVLPVINVEILNENDSCDATLRHFCYVLLQKRKQ